MFDQPGAGERYLRVRGEVSIASVRISESAPCFSVATQRARATIRGNIMLY